MVTVVYSEGTPLHLPLDLKGKLLMLPYQGPGGCLTGFASAGELRDGQQCQPGSHGPHARGSQAYCRQIVGAATPLPALPRPGAARRAGERWLDAEDPWPHTPWAGARPANLCSEVPSLSAQNRQTVRGVDMSGEATEGGQVRPSPALSAQPSLGLEQLLCRKPPLRSQASGRCRCGDGANRPTARPRSLHPVGARREG